MFTISTNSNGSIIVYIKGKRYKYFCDNIARIEFLKNKYSKKPGKLFAEIKKISKLEEG